MKGKHLFYLLVVASLLAGIWALPVAGQEPTPSAGQAPAGAVDLTLGVAPTIPDNLPAGGSVPAGGSPLLVLDDFNRADGPLGPDWSTFTGSCSIVSEAARCSYGVAVYTGPGAGDGSEAAVDVQTNGTPLQYVGVVLHAVNGGSYPFLKVQDQSGDGRFEYGACYLGNNGGLGSFGLGFYPLDQSFASAHMSAKQEGTTVTIEFTNVDGGTLPDQTYVCTGAPAPSGSVAGIDGYAMIAQVDNFGYGAAEPGIYINPENQGGGIEPGGSDDFNLNLLNASGGDEIVDFTYSATGPGTCSGPAASPLLADGESWPFVVTVNMDPGAQNGDVVDCEIYGLGQYSGYDDTAYIHAEAAYPGPPAYALDVYPGYNLVHWDDVEIPNGWTVVGSVPGFRPAGDFLGDNFDILYALNYDTNAFSTIDTATGAETIIGTSTPTGSWTGMAGTADGSTLYASSSNCGVESYLYEVDPGTGALTLIGPMRAGSCMIDIAINADGDMYGVDIVDDSLYQIDTGTGAATYVGYTGASANYAQGMDFDNASGTLYWAAYTTGGEMRTIDLNTGASTLLGSTGAEMDCLAIPTVPGGAPCVFATHVRIIPLGASPLLLGIVRVATGNGAPPVPGATVDVEWTLPIGGGYVVPQSRVTNGNGLAFPIMIHPFPGTYYLDLVSISAPGYDYCPDQNFEDHASWTP